MGKKLLPPTCLALALLLIASALLIPSRPAQSAPLRAPAPQADLPGEGWVVCQIGGMETIPGVGSRQVFELCNGDFWRVRAYCTEPGVPVPPQDAVCSLTGGTNFFCGAGVQSLALYGLLQTPGIPTETPTSTATATASATATATITPTSTDTATATASPTATATSATATGTTTATAAATVTVLTPMQDTQVVETGTPTQTPYWRPRAGGPGNLGYLTGGCIALGVIAFGFAASLTVFALLRRRARTINE